MASRITTRSGKEISANPVEINFHELNSQATGYFKFETGISNDKPYMILYAKQLGGFNYFWIWNKSVTSVFYLEKEEFSGDEYVDTGVHIVCYTSEKFYVSFSNTQTRPTSKASTDVTVTSITYYDVHNEVKFYNLGSVFPTVEVNETFNYRPSTITMRAINFPVITREGFTLIGWNMSYGSTSIIVSGEEDVNLPAGVDTRFDAIWQPITTSNISIYDGDEWKSGEVYVYDGTSWKKGEPYIYTGSTWKKGI